MGILFAMPEWSMPSELFLQRMLMMLEPKLAFVAVNQPPTTSWRGQNTNVPALQLEDWPLPLSERGLRKLGLRGPRPPALRMARAFDDHRVTAALINFLSFAARFTDAIEDADIPVFVQCHGGDTTWDLRSHEDSMKKVHGDDYQDHVNRIAQKATFIVNSHDTHARLEDIGITPERIAVNYPGVPIPPSANTSTGEDVNILYLGRLVDCKGPEQVIQAFEIACDRGLQGRLTLAGDGPLRETCTKLHDCSRHQDRIQLLGAVEPELGEELRSKTDIFTAHNRLGPVSRQREALGISILEAMAHGIPIVTGRSGGVTETVVDGETGYLIEPGDVEAHAERLISLAKDPELRNRLGHNARQRVIDHFSLEQQSTGLHKILGV